MSARRDATYLTLIEANPVYAHGLVEPRNKHSYWIITSTAFVGGGYEGIEVRSIAMY